MARDVVALGDDDRAADGEVIERGSQGDEVGLEALVVGRGCVGAMEGEVGGEAGVDFLFVRAGQFELADADQAVDAILQIGISE